VYLISQSDNLKFIGLFLSRFKVILKIEYHFGGKLNRLSYFYSLNPIFQELASCPKLELMLGVSQRETSFFSAKISPSGARQSVKL